MIIVTILCDCELSLIDWIFECISAMMIANIDQ